MQLFTSLNSPYARKARIIIHELGLTARVEEMIVSLPADPKLRSLNPLGKIPTLVLGDNTVLYDSPVICEYLDTLHEGPKLFPQWPERLTALRRLALGDGMLDIALAWVGERFRSTERQSAPHMALWEAKLRACVDALETEADALSTGALTIGHIGIGVALSYLDFRFDDLRWRDGHQRLATWHATFDARPSVVATPVVDDR